MGYHPTPKLVHEWAGTLEIILQYVKSNRTTPLELDMRDEPEMLYKNQYTLRRALKAADVFTNEKDGRYAGLGDSITIGVDTSKKRIIINNKHATPEFSEAEPLHETKRDEQDIVKRLKNEPRGKELFLDFFFPSPEYDEDMLREEIESLGWNIHTLKEGEEGMMLLNCNREVKSAFSHLESYRRPQ